MTSTWDIVKIVRLFEFVILLGVLQTGVINYAFNGVNFSPSLPNPTTHTHNLGVKPEFYETLVYVADNINFTANVRQTIFSRDVSGGNSDIIWGFKITMSTNNSVSLVYYNNQGHYSNYMKIITKRTY